MNEIEKSLWNDYNQLDDLITVLATDDERKDVLLERKERILNMILKCKQSENDINLRKEELNMTEKREKNRNIISIVTFSISTTISLYAIAKTFRFDQSSTVTSTLGRNILNGVVSKII